ncbi:MAG: bifunctional hydroxymethylpyrimidine kinase/phosphomethylpyrimidine kinase [Gemmatimonadetes bacterium]|nr:bifunctional hydroxymethylpyrimidine kinase/phosphomethylpyrimidine kinase [Gemmatimonadota bacterium]
MILTITPNPSLDLLFRAERLVWDDANRIPLPRRRPGGQGINVVRAARALEPNAPARAIALLSGAVGRELSETLAAEGTPLRVVPLDGESRVFVGVRETETGRSLLLNPRGPAAGEAEAAALLDAVEEELAVAGSAGRAGWVACCGSLPPGLPTDLFARIGVLARGRGHRFVADCDGAALRLAVAAGCDLLVPNIHEAGRLLGREIGATGAVDAARSLLELGPEVVVVTLGAEGAVAVSGEGAWTATPDLPAELRQEADGGSAVGAGDTLLAALLLALEAPGGSIRSALCDGVAAGTATLLGRGSTLLTAADYARVRPHVRVTPA